MSRCKSTITLPNGRRARCSYSSGHPSDGADMLRFHAASDPLRPAAPPLAYWRGDDPAAGDVVDADELAPTPLEVELARVPIAARVAASSDLCRSCGCRHTPEACR